jgi:hypothetical protein
MGLMKKIFGTGGDAKPPGTASLPAFRESETTVEKAKERNAPRRELIHVVLRETKRRHGIPSDRVGCRSLSVVTRQHKSGMHVQFIVHKGDEQLIKYVHAFQDAFWTEITRLDPFARQWLFSLAWQFDGMPAEGFAAMPMPASVPREEAEARDKQPPEAGDTLPGEEDAEDLESDLAALYAIRDAALSAPGELADVPDAKPRKHRQT